MHFLRPKDVRFKKKLFLMGTKANSKQKVIQLEI